MRLIDADALKERLDYCTAKGMGSTIAFILKHMIDEQPTVEKRKRGKWKPLRVSLFLCSECCAVSKKGTENFCPSCGADMKEV